MPLFLYIHIMGRLKITIGLLLLLLINSNGFAQVDGLYHVRDTIKLNYHTGGAIDSIDLHLGANSSTLPGGGFNTQQNTLTPSFHYYKPGGLVGVIPEKYKDLRFSGLPHIGFAYSFGGNATQFVNAEYQQLFGSKILLNIDYRKFRSNGYLRNSLFSHDVVQFQLQRKASFYSFETKAAYESHVTELSGGLSNDTLANDFALDLIPVMKENAQSTLKLLNVLQGNYFDFSKDSLTVFGLFTLHELSIRNRRYSESDALSTIYSQINYDSTSTMDQYQWSQLTNGAGIVLKNKKHYLRTGLKIKFWNYQNLGKYADTIENNLFANYTGRFGKISVEEEFDMNLTGAEQEFYNAATLKYSDSRLYLLGRLIYSNRLPDYFQRFAFGNNYNWSTTLTKQQRLLANAKAGYRYSNYSFEIGLEQGVYANNLFYSNNSWVKDSIVRSLTQINASFGWGYRFLNFRGKYCYSISSQDRIVPQHQGFVRLYLKGGLFKAKKMIGYLGIDAALISSFEAMTYIPMIDAFDLNSPMALSSGYSNLHFFTGFEIDQFRFYVRFENIGYFWNDHTIEVLNGYPVPSGQLRVGLTWDFFN